MMVFVLSFTDRNCCDIPVACGPTKKALETYAEQFKAMNFDNPYYDFFLSHRFEK